MAKTKKNSDLELDGKHLEGGGQLIRIAICLSALTRRPIRIEDIRGNRPGGGGLKAQHLACVQWLAKASNASVKGAEKGSKRLVFSPGDVDGDVPATFTKCILKDGREVYETRVDIGTAGSTGLAMQAVLPFVLFSAFPLRIPILMHFSGGTNVSGSP